MEPFATVADYEARYGKPCDEGRVAVLLEDASAALLSEYERHMGAPYREGDLSSFDRAAPGVACAMVHRAVDVPDAFSGASQYSQGAGGYTASVTLSNPAGDLYLGRADLRRLGLTGCRPWSIAPMTEADRG